MIEEPLGGAHRELEQMAEQLKQQLLKDLEHLKGLSKEQLLEQRYERWMQLGYC